jgi:cell division protein ZapA
MAEVEIQVAGHRYVLSCRDGDEDHLRAVASVVHAKVLDAGRTMGGMSEARQLLFAALLLADENEDLRATATARAATAPPTGESDESDAALATALERLAERMESLANRVEAGAQNA